MRFEPSYHVYDTLDVLPLGKALRAETIFYQASYNFAHDNGGPIVQAFLDKISLPRENLIIDVRVHHLQKGYYPAIPGWHLDWVPRKNKGLDPDMDKIPDAEHVVCILGETSLTEFVAEPMDIQFPVINQFIYAGLHIDYYKPETWHVSSGDMVYFTSRDWHRPTPAAGPEWRMLMRASSVKGRRPVNEIRTQSQVYIPTEGV